MNELKVLSAFLTVDGEANVWGPGHWSVFVRFAGCSVGCIWCDTKYSWSAKQGEPFTPLALADAVRDIGGEVRKVTITGGEPLEQDWPQLLCFIKRLIDRRYNVTVETAGTKSTIEFRKQFLKTFPYVDIALGQLTFVVDYKLASSNFKGVMDYEHFRGLRRGDVVKFVVGNEADFEEASKMAHRLDKERTFLATMYFSPCEGQELSPADLFYKMKEVGLDQLGVGYNLQAHKYIFPKTFRDEEEGGVDFTKHSMGRAEFLARNKK